MVEYIKPVLTVGGGVNDRRRVAEVSYMIALFGRCGIPAVSAIPPDGQNGFIPSAIWRTLRSGLISTTRFLGILFYNGLKLAVYNIGDGNYEWQLRAECSLHYRRYDTGETQLNGILLVCDNGCGIEVGKQIIRRTLWERKVLLKSTMYQKTKPVAYAKAPIHRFYIQAHLKQNNPI